MSERAELLVCCPDCGETWDTCECDDYDPALDDYCVDCEGGAAPCICHYRRDEADDDEV